MDKATPRYSLQVHRANQNIARVVGLTVKRLPDHEGGGWYIPLADAEIFVRAQHIDALMGAARELIDLAEDTDDEEIKRACAKVDAILAQMEGGNDQAT